MDPLASVKNSIVAFSFTISTINFELPIDVNLELHLPFSI